MKCTFLLVIVVGLFSSVAAALAWQQTTGKESLEGEWKLVSVEINGQRLSMDNLRDARLAVHGPKYSLSLGDIRLEMTHVLFADKQPNQMDLTVTEGPEKGQVFRAIYKLEADRLTVSRNINPGLEYPTDFATRPDTGLMLVVWNRQKH